MAILEPPQNIPSELLADMKKVGGIIRANNTAMRKYPKHLTGEGTALQQWYRHRFSISVSWFRGQPYVGGVPVHKLGGRLRSWWFNEAIGSGLWYVNYFMKQSLPLVYTDVLPDWAHRIYLLIADTQNARIFGYVKSYLHREYQSENYFFEGEHWAVPSGVCFAGIYYFASNTGSHEIVQLSHDDLAFLNRYGTQGPGNTQFNSPHGLTADEVGLFVADTWNHRIKVHDLDTMAYMSQVGTQGAGNDQFENPQGICVDFDFLYVADTGNHRIQKRNIADLTFVSKIGTWGIGDDQFKSPSAIFCDDTHLYIADTGNHRIQKRLKADLSFVAKIGSFGTGDNNFHSPEGICVGYTYVYVADTQNSRIKKHKKSDLSFVAEVGSKGAALYNFNLPRAIACNIEPLSF